MDTSAQSPTQEQGLDNETPAKLTIFSIAIRAVLAIVFVLNSVIFLFNNRAMLNGNTVDSLVFLIGALVLVAGIFALLRVVFRFPYLLLLGSACVFSAILTLLFRISDLSTTANLAEELIWGVVGALLITFELGSKRRKPDSTSN